MRRLFLYGPPASGKSTLGALLARAIGARFADVDQAVVELAGQSVAEIFQSRGEAAFRELESQALRQVVAGGAEVVALGGGTLLDRGNREFCEQAGAVVVLAAPAAEELERRLALDAGARPLGDQSRQRAAHYADFARRVSAFFDLGDSLVLVGGGLASAFLADEWMVTEATVAALHESRLGAARPLHVLSPGEEHKTPVAVAALWSSLARARLGRRQRVAAVGGGVTGDLTGFAAATWMRGIDWINLPTTLLAMVDAAVGGKTGCDLPEGKNLVGAFHSPRLVVIDTDFLTTLPAAQLADGRAEMIKHEIIGGQPGGTPAGCPSAAEIAASLAVKVGIVREDPQERTGRRQLLNCGHTFGHALERASEYRFAHGQCVAIGCVAEARLAVRLGLASAAWPEELAARFRRAGLPTEIPAGLGFARLRPWLAVDKKMTADGRIALALPCGWGKVVIRELDCEALADRAG